MATIQYGTLVSTATTADQVITSFTPAGTTSWKSTVVTAYLTTWSATEARMGEAKLQQGGVDKAELRAQNSDLECLATCVVIPWGSGLVFTGSEVVRWIVTPFSSTSMTWNASLFGQG